MIKVNRDYNDVPRVLLSDVAQKGLDKIFVDNSHQSLSLRKSYILKELKEKLLKLYQRKCAYCEDEIDLSGFIENYRPLSLYPWLTFEWSNFLPTCSSCCRYKASNFPLKKEENRITHPQLERKEWLVNSKSFLSEEALILHPEIDFLEEHLSFLPDGRIIEITERGKTTIQILNLNRDDLIYKRTQIIRNLSQHIEMQLVYVDELAEQNTTNQSTLLKLAFENIFINLTKKTNSDQPFAAFSRTIFNNFSDFFKNIENSKHKELLKIAFQSFLEKTDIRQLTDYKPKTLTLEPTYKELQKVVLQSIEIENIKCFKHTKINFNKKDTIILGVNGRGKTTILQLLALGLTETDRPPFENEWTNVKNDPKTVANFILHLSIDNKKYQLFFEIDEEDKVNLHQKSKVVLSKFEDVFFLAYGTGRNTISNINELRLDRKFKNVATLFGINSLVKNGEIESYLKEGNGFEQIKRIITLVFNHAEELKNRIELFSFDSSKNTFLFKIPTNNQALPLNAMSSGFRTSFQWILDMVIRMWQKGFDLEYPEMINGIVLIDEIDTHLHIKWQRTILNSLNTIFRNIQFIITTHSPFIVQSLQNKTVIALQLIADDEKEDYVIAETVHDIEPGSSYESIIEELFDEESTFNVEIEKQFEYFYQKRDAILKGKTRINDPEFLKIAGELTQKGEEIQEIIAQEKRQLKYLLQNNQG